MVGFGKCGLEEANESEAVLLTRNKGEGVAARKNGLWREGMFFPDI